MANTAMHLELQLMAIRGLMVKPTDQDWQCHKFVYAAVTAGLVTDFKQPTTKLPHHVLMPLINLAASTGHHDTQVAFDGDVDQLLVLDHQPALFHRAANLKREHSARLQTFAKRHLADSDLREFRHVDVLYRNNQLSFSQRQAQLTTFVADHPSLAPLLAHLAKSQQQLDAEMMRLATPAFMITQAPLVNVADDSGSYHLTMPTDDQTQVTRFIRHFSTQGGRFDD